MLLRALESPKALTDPNTDLSLPFVRRLGPPPPLLSVAASQVLVPKAWDHEAPAARPEGPSRHAILAKRYQVETATTATSLYTLYTP